MVVVEFRLLGSVEVLRDGHRLDVGHARQQCVLVVLLIEANTWVSVDQLVDRVWGAQVSGHARSSLYSYVSRLRRALDSSAGVVIARGSGGYEISVDPAAVDLHRFTGLLARARTAGDAALAPLDEALGLWRGEAFANLSTPWLDQQRAVLDQQRAAAELDRTDVLLARGAHRELVAELSARDPARPLDERLAAQLMLALYRCGRQAEALDHYRIVRQRLADELGTDPSPSLQRLHQQVLRGDPTLTLPAAALEPRRSQRPPAPRQLPAPPRLFTGRADELARISKLLDAPGDSSRPVVITAIGGSGGIGKTWLALHWAHHNLDRFPDGQLYVDLHGFDPAGEPLVPAVVVHGFLAALGVDPAMTPPDPQARTGLYRSLMADRRMLVILDNARDSEQVVPLLPGASGCTVLVTSRNRLDGLLTAHGAHPVALDVLGEVESRELLIRHLGADRVAAEPRAVAELLARCAGLPLAIGIVAARAAAAPAFSLAVLAEELRDGSDRLDALSAGELSVNLREVFSWSYHALGAGSARMFRLLGLVPGPDIDVAAAASLAGLPRRQTRAVLRELETAHLVRQHVPGRYRMHDLVRLYAAELARSAEAEPTAALRRLVDFYVHTAHAGERLVDPHRRPLPLDPPVPGCRPLPLSGEPAVLAWMRTEHAGLLAIQQCAAEQGWHQAVWQLAWALNTFQYRRGDVRAQLTTWERALTAANETGDQAAQTLAHKNLGTTYGVVHRHAEALDHLRLALAAVPDDVRQQAHLEHAIAWVWSAFGDDREALEHATIALRLFGEVPDEPAAEAIGLNSVGWYAARLGEFDEARTQCEQALAIQRRLHAREDEAITLDSLGYIANGSGRPADAVTLYRQALALHRELGNAYEVANTLERIGHPLVALGQLDQARAVWREARELFRIQHRTADTHQVQGWLHDLDQAPHPADR